MTLASNDLILRSDPKDSSPKIKRVKQSWFEMVRILSCFEYLAGFPLWPRHETPKRPLGEPNEETILIFMFMLPHRFGK